MAARSRPAVLSSDELVRILGRSLVEVDVLADLLALAVRSNAPANAAARRLEAAIERIPAQYAALLEELVVPGAKTKPRAGSSAGRRRFPADIERFDAAVDAAVAAIARKGKRR